MARRRGRAARALGDGVVEPVAVARVPSQHDHKLGEWIVNRAEVDQVVTFELERV